MMLTNAFFFIVVEFIEFVCFWQDHCEKLVKRQKERWGQLTAPLTPYRTAEERLAFENEEAQRKAIALSNHSTTAYKFRDTDGYNYKTWWAEYAHAKRFSVAMRAC